MASWPLSWGDVRLFLAVAEGGSVSQAARRMQLKVQSGGNPSNPVARAQADLPLRLQGPGAMELLTPAELRCIVAACTSSANARRLPDLPRPGQIDWIDRAPTHEHLPVKQPLTAAIPDARPGLSADGDLAQLAACHAGVGAMERTVAPHGHALTQGLVRLDLSLGPTEQAEPVLVAHRHTARAAPHPVRRRGAERRHPGHPRPGRAQSLPAAWPPRA
ncbi:hypothetical protein ACS5PK_16585 [Roseateles sp. DB2]|uniref:hypothetical protein n=1 Tax=Roseateles sp. DB2 TaxID=3453717 RepID=UPI003EECE8E2